MSIVVAKSPVVPPCVHGLVAPGTSPCAPTDRKWILVATVLGSSLAFMDGSVVNVALPTLQSTFGATSGSIQWIVQSYALFGAALLLLGGALGDRYGRRRAFVWGIALFALASAGCSTSQSLGQLIAARSIQGLGAALLVPQGLSILTASFPEEDRGHAIGTWSAWTSVFAALGPVAGGWLMQAWSWRLIFLLNLPFAFFVLLLSSRIPESRAFESGGQIQPLDAKGAVLNTLSLAAIIYALSFAPELGWKNPKMVGILVGGCILFGAFLKPQTRSPNAMMPLSLFSNPRFLAANLLTFLLYGALGGALYAIPFYLIQVRHYSPVQAGAVFLPLIVLMFFFSARIGGLVPKVGERVLLVSGSLIAGLGFAAFALLENKQGYVHAVLPGVLLLGLGMTLSVAPLSTAVMSSVPDGRTGIASAVNNAISRIGGLLAVSLLALLLSHSFSSSLQTQLNGSQLPIASRNEILAHSARLHDTPIPKDLSYTDRSAAALILDRAFLSGFRSAMLACAVCAWMGAFVTVFLLGKREVPPHAGQRFALKPR